MSELIIASVTSEARPKTGQSHRSSGNFSTDTAPINTTGLRWEVRGTNRSSLVSNVSFDVMIDVSAGRDKTEFSGLTNGRTTAYKKNRKYYIANPEYAPDEGFIIDVFALY